MIGNRFGRRPGGAYLTLASAARCESADSLRQGRPARKKRRTFMAHGVVLRKVSMAASSAVYVDIGHSLSCRARRCMSDAPRLGTRGIMLFLPGL